MRTKKFIYLNIAFLLLLFLAIAFIDQPLAGFVATRLTLAKPFFFSYTYFWDSFSSQILWVLVCCLGMGVCCLFSKKTKRWGFVLLTIVITHLAASAITNIMKTKFQRARPELYLNSTGKTKDFYNSETRDYSFPSSHTSFYLSLFLPVAFAFRKYVGLLLLLPGIIIMGRIILNEHYLSDVLFSILLVFNVCYLFYTLLCRADEAKANLMRRALAKSR